MDNLSSPKAPRTTQIIQDCGAWPLFLPPYSPDPNPIEMAFAALKELLQKQGAQTIDALWQAIGDLCDLFKSVEWRKIFSPALPVVLVLKCASADLRKPRSRARRRRPPVLL